MVSDADWSKRRPARYFPVAIFSVSPAVATATARSMVLHGFAASVHVLSVSRPRWPTKRSVARAGDESIATQKAHRARRTASTPIGQALLPGSLPPSKLRRKEFLEANHLRLTDQRHDPQRPARAAGDLHRQGDDPCAGVGDLVQVGDVLEPRHVGGGHHLVDGEVLRRT